MGHPADDVLFRFLQVAASRQENLQVVRHLLSRCPGCAARLRKWWPEPPPDPPPAPEAYDEVFDRLEERVREWSRAMPLRSRECREPAGPSAGKDLP